ncbi:MAG TPA: acyl-CoA dehydrogenase family protein, partial [Ramlibacter sp.]|nr:acyl-CoA dehydrogenase family protein [Ramlibacter sp.]
ELAARFGAVLLPEPFAQCAVAPAALLAAAPASPLREQLAEELCLGSRLLALAWQHTAGAAEPTWTGVTLRSQDGGWILSGTRQFTEARADCWLVAAANLDGESCIVAVPAGSAGLVVTAQAMADGTATATLQLHDVRLPADALLLRGQTARQALLQALDDARLVLAAELAGVTEGALAITAAYVAQRVQFGQPIASFQAVRHRLVDIDLQQRLAFASWRQAAAAGPSQRSPAISAAKARCGEAALLAARAAIQLHGAIGYTQEADPGLFLDSALRLASTLGNAPLHRRRFVDHMLSHRPAPCAIDAAAAGAENPPDFAQLSDEAFAGYLRGWLPTHCPTELRKPVLLRLRGEHERAWLRKLCAHGLRSPGIPREYGGMGLPLAKQLIYKKVFDEHGVARVLDLGGSLLAPALIRYGSAEQKAHYLPRILNCDDMWCQGYSEPGAGSDLASLRTSAVRDGDDFLVNGQKIWTSHASTASHIFLLARTRTDGKPQAGISFFLLDLKTPGITIRPIVNLAGDDEFCEVFFDQVRVPAANLVGGLHEGWTVAKSLLGVERLVTGSPTLARQAFEYLRGLLDAPDVRTAALRDERFQRAACDLHDTEALYATVCAAAVAGGALDAEYSVIKVLSTELFQRIADFAMEWANERGGTIGECDFAGSRFDLHRLNMIARPGTLYGGTSEVQRDILARLLLGAPTGTRRA